MRELLRAALCGKPMVTLFEPEAIQIINELFLADRVQRCETREGRRWKVAIKGHRSVRVRAIRLRWGRGQWQPRRSHLPNQELRPGRRLEERMALQLIDASETTDAVGRRAIQQLGHQRLGMPWKVLGELGMVRDDVLVKLHLIRLQAMNPRAWRRPEFSSARSPVCCRGFIMMSERAGFD